MSAQAQLDAVYAYCRAISASDVEAVAPLLSDESFFHCYLPATVGPEAQGTRGKVETLTLFKYAFADVLESMTIHLPPREVVQGKDKVVLLVEDTGKKTDGEPYRMEYVLFFSFTPGTDKISSITEFQDSISMSKVFAGWYEKSTM